MTTAESTRESGQEPDGREETDSSEETPTVAEALDVPDTGESYPMSATERIHGYEPGEERSVCGGATLAVDDDYRSRAVDAAHDHSLVHGHWMCGNCNRIVRSRVRDGDLSTGDERLDTAIRASEGDEIIVETPESTHRVVVETSEWGHACQRVVGRATDFDGDAVEYPDDSTTVRVEPDGSVKITAPGSLTCDHGERDFESGDIRPVSDANGADGGQSA